MLDLTTDVASHPEFAARRTTKTVDGITITGWFSEDFTLEEMKTLQAIERIPDIRPANARLDGQFEVPTWQEIIDQVKAYERLTGRTIGIYPQTKHPTYFDRLGLSLEEPLIRLLRRNGYEGTDDRVFIQSFEISNQFNAPGDWAEEVLREVIPELRPHVVLKKSAAQVFLKSSPPGSLPRRAV